jgi:signal transduction histidine kinase
MSNAIKRWLPLSTTGQLITLVFVTTLIAHLSFGMLWYYLRDIPGRDNMTISEQIRPLARACASISDDACAAALRAASTPNFQARLANAPDPGGLAETSGNAALAQSLSAEGPARVSGGGGGAVAVAVEIRPGRWMAVTVSPEFLLQHHPTLFMRFFGLLVAVAIPLVGAAVWTARQVTRPLVRLAALTEGLGTLPGAAARLPEQGTREVRTLAAAFNRLLERIARFVSDRTRVLAAVSHDLRTPLTRIRLRAESVTDEGARERLLRDVRMMEMMIDSSLSLLEAEEQQEAEERLDLGVLVQTICDEFADTGFDVSYQGPLHTTARCRPRALERALSNVINNALKFGGAAEVAMRVLPRAIEIDIADEGPGIEAGEKTRVMEPFYRGQVERGPEQQGNGLGLAVARAVVLAHGGAIALLDRVPRGLCVRLTLPRVA